MVVLNPIHLVSDLSSDSVKTVCAAASELAVFEYKDIAIAALLRLSGKLQPDTRYLVFEAMEKFSANELLKNRLVELAGSEDKEICCLALCSLGVFREAFSQELDSLFIARLSDPSFDIVEQAVLGLGNSQVAKDPVTLLLNDVERLERWATQAEVEDSYPSVHLFVDFLENLLLLAEESGRVADRLVEKKLVQSESPLLEQLRRAEGSLSVQPYDAYSVISGF